MPAFRRRIVLDIEDIEYVEDICVHEYEPTEREFLREPEKQPIHMHGDDFDTSSYFTSCSNETDQNGYSKDETT